MENVGNWLKLLRIKHWIKNLLVLFPLVFSGSYFEAAVDVRALWAFVAFCLMASAVYAINDVRDADADSKHPIKKARPVASGSIGKAAAIAAAALLAAASLLMGALLTAEPLPSLAVLACYAVFNLAYSLGLKDVPIADIAILASGFLFRILYGGTACGIAISSWLFLCVLCMALFFALGKRRGEAAMHGSASRKSLELYSRGFLDKNMYVLEGMGLVFYSLWTFSRIGDLTAMLDASTILLVMGVPMAMLACLRYSYDIESESSDGDPVEVALGDKALIAIVIVWAAVVVLGIYSLPAV